MPKQPKFTAFEARGKTPRHENIPLGKSVKISEQPGYDLKIGWNIASMDTNGKFKCTLKELDRYSKKIAAFESYTVRQILEKNHCHPMSPAKVSNQAKVRLDVLNIEPDTLRLSV